MNGRYLQLMAIIASLFLQIHPGSGLEFANYDYFPAKEAVLFFGAHNSGNEAAIQQIASNDSTLITWTAIDPIKNNVKYFHPIRTETETGNVYFNCLFLDPTNSTLDLITDYYMKKMVESVQSVKLAFITPLESLQPNNGSFVNLLEWIVRIFPNPEKFQPSMLLIVVNEDPKTNATVDTVMQLLSDFNTKIDTNSHFPSHPEKQLKMKAISKILEKPEKIAISSQPATAIQMLNQIPSKTVLPEDVHIYQSVEYSLSTVDETISPITDALVSTFNNAISAANSTMLNVIEKEEKFSNRLQILLEFKDGFENSKIDMMSAKDWMTAAEIMTHGFGKMKIALNSSFHKNVSIGHKLLTHVQTMAGTSGVGLQESLGRTAYDDLIKTTDHNINLYSYFMHTYDNLELQKKEQNFTITDSDEYLLDLLQKNDVTFDSIIENNRLRRQSAAESNDTVFLPQDLIPGTNLSTNTAYKIHLLKKKECFLTGATKKKVKAPFLVCSTKDKQALYKTDDSSWFLNSSSPSVFALRNLKIEDYDFCSVAQNHSSFVMTGVRIAATAAAAAAAVAKAGAEGAAAAAPEAEAGIAYWTKPAEEKGATVEELVLIEATNVYEVLILSVTFHANSTAVAVAEEAAGTAAEAAVGTAAKEAIDALQVALWEVGHQAFIKANVRGKAVAAFIAAVTAVAAEYAEKSIALNLTPATFLIRNFPNDTNGVELHLSSDDSGISFGTPNKEFRYEMTKGEAVGLKFEQDIKLHATLVKFEFTKPDPADITSSKKDLADSYDIINNSPAAVSRTITVSEKITDEISWGFSEDMTVFASVSAGASASASTKAEIPFVGGVEVSVEVHVDATAGTEASHGSHNDFKQTTEKEFKLEYAVNVPPHSSITISAWYEHIKDVKLPYTVDTEVTAKGKRITKYNEVVADAVVDGASIRSFLDRSGFKGEVLQISEFGVVVRIGGEMTASAGVNGMLGVNGRNISIPSY